MRFGTRPRLLAAAVGFSLVLAMFPAGQVCFAAPAAEFVAPVGGPIARRFVQPLGPYASGHRGVDFGVSSGTTVSASATGTVTFAGPVADDGLFITIDHGVVRTSYSFLSRVDVAAGQKVKQGDPIGLSGDGHPGEGRPSLHFGARIGTEYIDPEVLLFGSLDDISGLISLAPFSDEVKAVEGRGSPVRVANKNSPALRSIKAPELELPSGKSFFVRLGSRIAEAGSSVVRRLEGGARWIGSRIDQGVRLVSKAAGDAGRLAGEFGSSVRGAFDRAGRSVADAWRSVTRWVPKATDFSSRQIRRIGEALGRAGQWVSRTVDTFLKWVPKAWSQSTSAVGRALKTFGAVLGPGIKAGVTGLWQSGKNFARAVSISVKRQFKLNQFGASFLFGMGKGVIEQISCSRKGGAKPPSIPSAGELRRGVKAPAAPNDNLVIAIAGIGSHSSEKKGEVKGDASIYQMDFRTLGFSEDQIFHFSYRGIEDRGGRGPYGLHAPYTKEDTYKSIRQSARILRRQIDAIHRLYPDKKIDLVAHSQGGLVAEAYLATEYRPQQAGSPVVDHFVSIATPHLGTDLAELHSRLQKGVQARLTLTELDAFARALGFPPPSSASAVEMAEDSEFIQGLSGAWNSSLAKTTTISDSVDWVVPSQHTRLRGANHYTADMPGLGTFFFDHGAVVNAMSTKGILYNALADRTTKCTALRNAFADNGPGKLISNAEDIVGDAIETSLTVSPVGALP